MLTVPSISGQRFCDRISRRGFIRVGALGLGALSLPRLLELRANGAVNPKSRGKSVIMICLGGGPSQIDMYDMKPDAPADYRGEFHPIKTNLPGFQLCELMPRQATLADKFSIVRNVQWVEPDHQRAEVFSGYPVKAHRPSFGSIVSRLYQAPDLKLPKFVSLSSEYNQELQTFEDPGYVGAAHRAFIPTRRGLENFDLRKEITLDRLGNRKDLLASLDNVRRDLDRAEFAAADKFTAQALDMITSRNVREAFDIEREPPALVERYGQKDAKFEYNKSPVKWDFEAFIKARRLAEAGVPYISLQVGLWDHHGGPQQGSIFHGYRTMLPLLDQSLSALIEDLYDRGLDRDVAVLVWGEFGRTPKVNAGGGRDHWPQAGCAMFIGGGLKMGQIVGATDRTAALPTTQPYTPQNVLATLYHVLGIDPATALPDHNGRPIHLLDDRDPIAELV
jgi:uncharacterized protein (DUF1501 family)